MKKIYQKPIVVLVTIDQDHLILQGTAELNGPSDVPGVWNPNPDLDSDLNDEEENDSQQ